MAKRSLKEIERLDKQILSLIMERAFLFSEYLKERKIKGLPFSSGEVEGELWHRWHKKIKGKKINSRILRNIYNYLNHLSYDLAEREEEREFLLSPRKRPASINYIAPLDVGITRFLTFFSATCNFPVFLKKVVLTDALYDMLKVLNSAGANFKWSRDSVEREQTSPLNFDGQALFVGGDKLNLYLLLFYALSKPCICKFTGEASLRMADLRPLFGLLPQLGARIVPFIPSSYGLPVRVEATGSISDELQIKGEMPEEMLVALMLMSPLFSPATILKIERFPSSSWLKRILWVYDFVGIDYEIRDNFLKVYAPPADIKLFSTMSIPMDMELASYLLAMPFVLKGRAEVRGCLSGRFPEEQLFKEILSCFGSLEVYPEKVISYFPPRLQKIREIDIKENPIVLPLGWALAVTRGEDGVSLVNIPCAEMDTLVEICEKMGLAIEAHEGRLIIYGNSLKDISEPLVLRSPSPRWSLALSLVAAGGNDIVLENPGEITALWPSFWPLYRSLPEINEDQEKIKGGGTEEKKRRRILVVGNKKIGEGPIGS